MRRLQVWTVIGKVRVSYQSNFRWVAPVVPLDGTGTMACPHGPGFGCIIYYSKCFDRLAFLPHCGQPSVVPTSRDAVVAVLVLEIPHQHGGHQGAHEAVLVCHNVIV